MPRLALIGAGRWGQNILRTLQQEPDVTLDVADTPDQAAAILKQAQQGQLDGVLIATPGATHADIALPYISLGLPCFIEKPLTTSVTDANQLSQAAQASGAPVLVGHIHLFNPAYQAAKALLPQLGPLRQLHFEGMNNGPYRSDMSALWDWAPHDIAMALDLLATTPQSVSAWGINALRPDSNLTDTVFAKLVFAPPTSQPQPVPVTMHLSWLMPEKRKKLTIVGETSSLIYDDTAPQKVTLFQGMGPKVQGQVITWQQPEVTYPKYSGESPLALELKAFLAMVSSKQPPFDSLGQGLQVVEIIEQIEKAIAA